MASAGRQGYHVFLSAVSSEFETARRDVVTSLRKRGLDVRIREQSEFQQEPGADTTLDKLHKYVRECEVVIAVFGQRSGAFPPENAVTAEYRAMLPPGFSRASYTQWEVIFARRYRRRLLRYVADAGYKPDRAPNGDDEPAAQQLWLDYLFHDKTGLGLDRESFGSADGLVRRILERRDWPDLSQPKPKNLPYISLGSLFKGREAFLQKLRQSFIRPGSQGATAIVGRAMHGLGGIGKTRAAVEYALAHEAEYSALLFVTARTPEDLENNFAALAGVLLLDLPEAGAISQDAQVTAVLDWLDRHPGWFLIVDNVDTEKAARAVEALLAKLSGGHVAITSRIGAWHGGVEALQLDLLAPDAAHDLLRDGTPNREKRPDEEADIARLAHELGYLSLALTQAAALIDTDFSLNSFSAYLAEWEKSRSSLLATHNDRDMGYPLAVAATWLTTFEQLNEPARALLNVLAFFAPEPIPRFLAETVDKESGERLLPREAFNDLARYSFLARDRELPVFTIHRLVQQVARDRMSEAEAAMASAAATGWIAAVIGGSDPQDVRSWPLFEPLLPHALSILDREPQGNEPAGASFLLNEFGLMLRSKASSLQAEPLYRRALAINEKSYGPDHPTVGTCLNNLAELLQATNRLAEAEPLFRRALAINEKSHGPDHPEVATCLNNLAGLLQATNRLAEAEPLFRRSLAINEKSYGPDHPAVAIRLSNLAALLRATNRLAESEPLFWRALAIDEKSYGPDHPAVAIRLNNLAALLRATNRLAEAEPLFRRALAINEKSYGPDHPTVGTCLSNLAGLLRATNRLAESEPLYRRALAIDEKSYGPDHPTVAIRLNNLAGLLQTTNRLAEAEPLFRRALRILLAFAAATGHPHPNLATVLRNYAIALEEAGRDRTEILAELDHLFREAGLEPPEWN